MSDAGDAVVLKKLEHIEENPYQTRNHFGPEALEELANSIRSNGVVQPVVVRPGVAGRYLQRSCGGFPISRRRR